MMHIVSSHSHPGMRGRSGKGRTSGDGNGTGKMGSMKIGSVGKGSASLDVEAIGVDAAAVTSCCGKVHFCSMVSIVLSACSVQPTLHFVET